MKKVLFICSLFVGLSSFGQAFEKGQKTLSLGVGLGAHYHSTWLYNTGFAIPFNLNFDLGVHEYVSVGVYGGFYTRRWNNSSIWNNSSERMNSIHFGVRGSFHWFQLLDNLVNADLKSDIFDIYVSPWVGYNIMTWSNSANEGRAQVGSNIGARFYLKDKIALFGEVGYTPTSYTSVGVCFKL